MIMRNTLKPAEQERHAACHDGHLKVFNHHVYEIRKGLRDLVLQTLPSKHASWITRKLENLDIAYLIISAGQRNINVFLRPSGLPGNRATAGTLRSIPNHPGRRLHPGDPIGLWPATAMPSLPLS